MIIESMVLVRNQKRNWDLKPRKSEKDDHKQYFTSSYHRNNNDSIAWNLFEVVNSIIFEFPAHIL